MGRSSQKNLKIILGKDRYRIISQKFHRNDR